jgi:hypothetical protein
MVNFDILEFRKNYIKKYRKTCAGLHGKFGGA